MNVQTNSAISVDCVIFGFDGAALMALLVRRKTVDPLYDEKELKLPGAMILENETLEEAACRVLEASTGLKGLSLKQIAIFSNPGRVSVDELKWICEYHGIDTDRVVTVGYYALVKLDQGMINYTRRQGALWVNVDDVHHLIMDHMDILSEALNALQKEMILSPAAFDLLPRKFTVRQLQNLFEAVFGVEIDNRNFRKKLFSSDVLIDTGEMETSVRHKPARLYTFNRNVFGKKGRPALNFMHILKYNKI